MPFEEFEGLRTDQVAQVARQAMSELAGRGDQEAFRQLLTMSAHAGSCLAVSARSLADAGSWSQVADLSGTTKQAAWSKWRQPS